MRELLCQPCINEGRTQCLFVATQNRIVDSLPPSEKQTPVANGTNATVEALEASKAITEERIRVRDERLCPQINYQSFNPKFIKHL